MIVKLRRKFIGIAMCSMALVLILMIVGINIASFVNVCQNADRRITMIADNNGRLPQNMKDGKAFSPDQRKTKQSLSPEAAFDTRFFTITFLPDGELHRQIWEKLHQFPARMQKTMLRLYTKRAGGPVLSTAIDIVPHRQPKEKPCTSLSTVKEN